MSSENHSRPPLLLAVYFYPATDEWFVVEQATTMTACERVAGPFDDEQAARAELLRLTGESHEN